MHTQTKTHPSYYPISLGHSCLEAAEHPSASRPSARLCSVAQFHSMSSSFSSIPHPVVDICIAIPPMMLPDAFKATIWHRLSVSSQQYPCPSSQQFQIMHLNNKLIWGLRQGSTHSVPVCTFLSAIAHYTQLWIKALSRRHSDSQLFPFFLLIFPLTIPLLHGRIIHRSKSENLKKDVPATCSRHSSICLVQIQLNIQTQNACANDHKADDPPLPKASSCVNPSRQCLKKVF